MQITFYQMRYREMVSLLCAEYNFEFDDLPILMRSTSHTTLLGAIGSTTTISIEGNQHLTTIAMSLQ